MAGSEFLDSLGDHYLTADFVRRYDSFAVSIPSDSDMAFDITSAAARSGGIRGLRLRQQAGKRPTYQVYQNEAVRLFHEATWVGWGFAFRYDRILLDLAGQDDLGFFSIKSGGVTQAQLTLRKDGTIGWRSGENTDTDDAQLLNYSSAGTRPGDFFFLEGALTPRTGATGTIDLWLNGVNCISMSTLITAPHDTVNEFAFGIPRTKLAVDVPFFEWHWDDFYLQVGHGASFPKLGVGRAIYLHAATGNGAHTDSTPKTGANRGDMVKDATPDGDGSYNTLTLSGQLDTYLLDDLPANTGVIQAIQCEADVASEIDLMTMEHVLRIAGTDYTGAAIALPLGVGYRIQTTPFDVSPATSGAFSIAEVNAMQAGLKLV